jgi:hypothetical protein
VNNAMHLQKVLSSWACRGRVLMLVYPPPGDMANNCLQLYLDTPSATPQQQPNHESHNNTTNNDILIYVGEGRGGANGNDAFFDCLEDGEWILLHEIPVQRPPGNKGYEKLFVLQRINNGRDT